MILLNEASSTVLGILSLVFSVFLFSIWGKMEEESCSWVTRAKFFPTVYTRSGSSGLPSITYGYKSGRPLDLEGKQFILESKPRDPGSASSKDVFQSGSNSQLGDVISVSEAKKKGTDLDSQSTSSTIKPDCKSASKLKESKVISSQRSSTQSSSHTLKGSGSQTADFSFHPDVITTPNSLKDSSIVSADSYSCKSSLQDDHCHPLSPMSPNSTSQTVDFSFNPDISTTLSSRDSKFASSDLFSSKSYLHYRRSQPLNPMMKVSSFQPVEFSSHFNVSTNSNVKNSDAIVAWFPSNKEKVDPRLHNSYLFYDQKEPKSKPKQRSVSPLPKSILSDVFKEAKGISKRFSTPPPHRETKKNVSRNSSFNEQKVEPRLHNSSLFYDQKEPKSKLKQRSVSPLPKSILSDVFKEAKVISKRFSTPPPHRETKNNVSRDNSSFNDQNLTKQISYGKDFDLVREKKESRRSRYFDGGVRVTAVETTDKWMVDLSELYFGARFAFGAHSRLYYGKYKDEPVAVKIIRLPDDDDSGVMAARLEKQFTRETTFLSHLYHRNVIKLAGACKKFPIFFIITEYLSGGSLRAFLHKLDHNPLPLDKLISIALDVSRGMEYIHSQGIIHRDLKPENILFDHNFGVKIADFGVACEEAYCDILEDDAGTYRWMAPEMIKHKPYGRKVDVYSFGLLLWEMITGSIPYEDMCPVQAAFAVVDKNIRPIISADSPVILRVLIEQCWSSVPEERPEFWQIVKVLEQFESDLARGEAPKHPQNLPFQDQRKRMLNWIEKMRPPKIDGFRPTAPKR